MKKFSKILVLLLTFSLLLGALAVFASADVSETDVAKIGDQGYATFDEAFAAAMAAEEPVTITLLADVSASATYDITADVTVDLNWHTITLAGGAGTYFTLNTDDVNAKFLNGKIVFSEKDLFSPNGNNAELVLSNVYVTMGKVANAYAIHPTHVGTNVPSVKISNSVIQAGRVMLLESTYINIDATNSIFKSLNNSNVIRINGGKFLDGELNFTNCHMWTGTGNNARLIEGAVYNVPSLPAGTVGEAGSAENLHYEYELVDGETYKITKIDNAVFNFYNCSFYSEGNVTIGPAVYEMHFYGGYYGNLNANSLLSNTNGIKRQSLGRVYFHTYTDEAGVVHYPTFNQDPSKSTHIVMPDIYDFDVTFTITDGSKYSDFAIAKGDKKANAAAIVENTNAEAEYKYILVPNPSGATESVPVVEGAADNFTDIGSLSGVAAHACPFPWVNINPWLAGKTLTKIGIPVQSVAALDENQTFTLQIFDYTTKVTREAVTVTLPLDQLGDSTTVNKWIYVDLTPYNITLGATESVAFGKTGDTVTWGYGTANTNTFDFANVHTDLTTGNYNTAEFTPTEGSTRAIIFDIYYAKPVAPADVKVSVADPIALPDAVAMLNGKLYTDFGLAAAAAGEDDIITLLANVSGGTEVTKLVTVNTNGFEFAPTIDEVSLMTQTVEGNLVAIVKVAADAEFVNHYYWRDAESCEAANDDENGFDWDSFDWEAGVAPEGLIAYKALPVGSSADSTSIEFAGVNLSYVDSESNYWAHTGWNVIGGSDEEFFFEYTPKTTNVGKATFLIINDATGAIIGSGYTDGDGLDDEEGDNTNYSAAFTDAMFNATSGTTIKLVSDIVIYSDNNQMGTSAFTLDLNGHTLSLAEGKCIGKGIAKSSTCNANAGVIGHACTFRCAGQLKLTIKSSLPGGLVYNTAESGNQFIWLNGNCTGGYLNIIGENLTIHSSTLVASSVKGTTNAAPFEINIDGGTYLTTDGCTSNGFIQPASVDGATTYNIKNAFIDSRGYHLTYIGQSKSVNFNQIINFENCVILLNDSFKVLNSKASQYYDHTFLSFKDCAVLGSPINDYSYTDGDGLFSTPTVNISGNCYFTHPVAAGGAVFANALVDVADYNVSVFSTYRFAKRNGAAYSPETHTAEFLLSKTDLVEYTVAYATTDTALSEQCATVNYTVGGEIFKTVNVLVSKDGVTNGATAANVSFSETENYVKSTYTGKVVVDKIDTYSVALDATKVVSVSGVKYNLTLASEIAINVAVPADVLNYLNVVVDGKLFTKEDATLVTIGEAQYYVISYTGITAINTAGTVEFAIVGAEGVTAKNIVTSVASYANTLMKKGATDVEKELGRALLVYTLEAYKALDAENTAAIEALTAYGAASVDDETFLPDDTSALAAYFTGAFLRLESTPGIVFVANEAAYGKTFTFTYVNEKLELVSEVVTFSAETTEFELEMKVYNLDQNITVTVEGADTVLSYNLDTYLASLAETNNAFAQAIYRYVAAAKAYVAPVVAE